MGVEREEAVGNIGIYLGDKPCDTFHFFFVNVPRHKQGASDKERRDKPQTDLLPRPRKIFKRSLVRSTREHIVQRLIPCLEIELDAPPDSSDSFII